MHRRLVDRDDETRRLAWSVVDGPYTHHNASAQVFTEAQGRTRFVWIADLLPNDLAARIGELMEQGTSVVKQTLEAAAAHNSGQGALFDSSSCSRPLDPM